MTDRENWLRAVTFKHPEWIPSFVSFAPLTWHTYREKLEDVVLRHPRLFPNFQRGSVDFDTYGPAYREGERFRDNWGCVWYNSIGGLEGQVVESPLADWNALKTYQPPDPLKLGERGPRDWSKIRERVAQLKREGKLVWADGERLFDRMYFLRGFENLMKDLARDDPHLPAFIDMLKRYTKQLVELWLELGVDVVGFHTDIGTQENLMISPLKFRKYIKPFFAEIFGLVRQAGALVSLSSDGNLLSIVDDLVEIGVNTHDPQFRACGLDGIERKYKGRLCAIVDLDRQMLPYCTPADIHKQVRDVVERMYLPAGGLMLMGTCWDNNTPLVNIEALCAALEEHGLDRR